MSIAAPNEHETIEAYLKRHENKEMLRFITCGSVDDGKSTLIGRLLHDTKMIYEDQLAAIERDSKKVGTVGEEIDLALLVDGLQSEREQGITIDVAYRYFSTDKRKFIIADTPGHEQYTRNMATGASTADLAILLIDARHGVQTQTKRHSFIVKLLGIKHAVIAINKMDLVGFSEEIFERIKKEFLAFAEETGLEDIRFIPLSALKGDFVARRGEQAPWYMGPTLLELLETLEISKGHSTHFRFPVQYVNRPNLDFRGFCGTVASGTVRIGDPVIALPSGKKSSVKSIVTYDGELESAFDGQAVTLTLDDEIDISRGDLIVHESHQPRIDRYLEAHLVWMHDTALIPKQEYLIKCGSQLIPGYVDSILHQIDINTLEHHSAETLPLNGIGLVHLKLSAPLIWDTYEENRFTGNFIVIDRVSNNTVGAGMITGAYIAAESGQKHYSQAETELNAYIRKHYPEWDCKAI